MSSLSATRRASSTAPRAQQASSRCISGMFGRSGQTLRVTPITSWPACLSRAAVTELSTPPDMPTITRAISERFYERDFREVARFCQGIVLDDAPRADGGRIDQAHQHVIRRQVGCETNVGSGRSCLGVGVRVVVADD